MNSKKVITVLKIQGVFWKGHPALYTSLGLLFPILATLHQSPILCMGELLLLSYPLIRWKNCLLLLFLMCGFYFGVHLKTPPTLPQEKGIAYFIPLKPDEKFGRSYIKGVITQFECDGKTISCAEMTKLPLPKDSHFAPNTHYTLSGKFILKKGALRFVPDKTSPWKPVPHTFSLVKIRSEVKASLKRILHKNISSPFSASFIHGLLSGDVDTPLLTLQLNKLGLQHVLAVSGFHFSLVFLFLTYFTKFLPSSKVKITLLLCGVLLFFLFIGNAPSVQRAWLSISILLIGQLLSTPAKGLNTLGVAFLIALIINPTVLSHLGFILSFAATFGILFFTPLWKALYAHFFPLSEESSTNSWKQRFLTFLKELMFLNLGVTTTTLPILLCLFHRFPLLSLVYNLFFPTLVSCVFFLVLLALMCLPICPFIAQELFKACSLLTEGGLYLVREYPVSLDYVLRTKGINVEVATLLLMAFLGCGIYLKGFLPTKKGLEEYSV